MTTAHRPTFDPAKGGTGRNEGDLAKLSQQYSSRDMPSHMTLKYRQKGQAHPDEINTKVVFKELFSDYLFQIFRTFVVMLKKKSN